MVRRREIKYGWLAGLLLVGQGCAATAGASEANGAAAHYSIVARIPGPDGMWDYAAIDSDESRLYVAQGEHISILNINAEGGDSWTQLSVPGAQWHGVVPIQSRGLLLGTDGHAHALTLFSTKTRQLSASVMTSNGPRSALSGKMAKFALLADPDALLVEPRSGLAAAVNGGSGEVAFIDLDRKAVVGRVQVGGKLEFAVADGSGRIFVNVQTAHEIAVIDVPTFSVVQRIPLAGCIEPKGLAYDPGTDLLISGCDNGVAKFVLGRSGQVVASRHIGRGADAVIIDVQRHRAFVPSGEDAVLSIFLIEDARHIDLIQTLSTEKGTRLGAVDVRSGVLYLPSATLGPPVPPRPWPSVVPGTFHILVVSSAGQS
jgi:hypothetical protein